MSLSAAVMCLAMNIYHEARSEPFEGKLAVAHVTMNRVKSPKFPNDVCSVVWQDSQFSWTNDGKSDKMKEKKHRREALLIASLFLQKHAWNKNDLTQGATFYHANYVEPFWSKKFEVTTIIGNHIFYKP